MSSADGLSLEPRALQMVHVLEKAPMPELLKHCRLRGIKPEGSRRDLCRSLALAMSKSVQKIKNRSDD
eukprot:10127471-Karenia_brevis.AAC.1